MLWVGTVSGAVKGAGNYAVNCTVMLALVM